MNFLVEETISCSAEFRFSTLFVMKAVKKERGEGGSKGKEWFRFTERSRIFIVFVLAFAPLYPPPLDYCKFIAR